MLVPLRGVWSVLRREQLYIYLSSSLKTSLKPSSFSCSLWRQSPSSDHPPCLKSFLDLVTFFLSPPTSPGSPLTGSYPPPPPPPTPRGSTVHHRLLLLLLRRLFCRLPPPQQRVPQEMRENHGAFSWWGFAQPLPAPPALPVMRPMVLSDFIVLVFISLLFSWLYLNEWNNWGFLVDFMPAYSLEEVGVKTNALREKLNYSVGDDASALRVRMQQLILNSLQIWIWCRFFNFLPFENFSPNIFLVTFCLYMYCVMPINFYRGTQSGWLDLKVTRMWFCSGVEVLRMASKIIVLCSWLDLMKKRGKCIKQSSSSTSHLCHHHLFLLKWNQPCFMTKSQHRA